jgi:DNA mismatch repair ATPase MutS
VQPLRDLTELGCRHQMIADLLQEPDLLDLIRTELKSIRDIERGVGRLSHVSGNARDLVALKTSLQQIPKLKAEFSATVTISTLTNCETRRATVRIGSANYRSARSPPPESNRSKFATIRCSAISSK